VTDIVKRIESRAGDRAVEVFLRSDGSYGFEEFKYVQPENAWIPTGPSTVSFHNSAETAEADARGRVDWLD
jgi:hypothetical protein